MNIKNYKHLYRKFINRDDVFSQQLKDGRYSTVNSPLKSEHLNNHISNNIPVGVYQLNKNNKVKWICFDFDNIKDIEGEKVKAIKLYNVLQSQGFHPLLEFSGNKGFHVWIFIEEIDAKIAKVFANNLLKKYKIDCNEIFPKQIELTEKNPFGNLVKLPLCNHQISKKRSVLFDDSFKELNLKLSILYLKKFNDILLDKLPKIEVEIETEIEKKIDNNFIKKIPINCKFIEWSLNHQIKKEGQIYDKLVKNVACHIVENKLDENKFKKIYYDNGWNFKDLDGWLKSCREGKYKFWCGELIKFQKDNNLNLKFCEKCSKYRAYKWLNSKPKGVTF